MSKKSVLNLNEFTKQETFVRLYDRAVYIESQIQQLQKIKSLDVNVINVLAMHKIDHMNMIRTYTESVFVLYRSMFQGSDWEAGLPARIAISTNAYSYDGNQERIHNEVIDHVDKVLAHQDIHCGEKRGAYPSVMNKHGKESYLVWNAIKNHVDALLPHVCSIKKAIKDAYNSKFGKELVLFAE